jgi:hypothetical protein
VLRACCKFLQAHLSAAVAIVLLLLPYAYLKLPRAHLVLPVSQFLLARVDPSSKYRESTLRLTTTESNSMSSETPIALATRGPKEPQDFGTPLMLEDFIPILEPTTIVNPCAVCHTPDAESRCSRCKNIRYCSTACQVLDWRRCHSLVCKRYINVVNKCPNKCPCPTCERRVMYFPTDSIKPIFAHLLFEEKGTVHGWEILFDGVPEHELKKFSFHDRNLPYFIQLRYDTNPHGKRVLKDTMSLGLPFRGPVIALAYDLETALSAPALNVDTTIIGPLMDFVKLLREYHGPIFIEVRY